MGDVAIQDRYRDSFSHCYGCGRLNEQGLHIRSLRDGDEVICTFHPRAYHVAVPGVVYGGLIASLIDCHGTGTAAAAAYRTEGRDMGTMPALRFVTASLKVDYVAPTPLGVELELRGMPVEVKERKVVVDIVLSASGKACAKGQVIAVRMPESMVSR